MCRWLVYGGPPIRVGDMLFHPANSIVRQSLDAHEGVSPVNGDGFGLGWFDTSDPIPCRFRSVYPAWNDVNLRDITRNMRASTFMAHVRASTGGAVQASNCHPFQHNNWLFCHNGEIVGYELIRRELTIAVAPEFFAGIDGTTDSELLFYLALTFGLQEEPRAALQRAVGFVEQVSRDAGIKDAGVQMTIGMTDGERVYAARYATEGEPRSLYHSTDAAAILELCPDHPDVQKVIDQSMHLVVSEPLDTMSDRWAEVAPSTFVSMHDGQTSVESFTPTI